MKERRVREGREGGGEGRRRGKEDSSYRNRNEPSMQQSRGCGLEGRYARGCAERD